ncbi:MAG: hypothetical protein U1E87_05635 [Alphaproteobacteria bacterium]
MRRSVVFAFAAAMWLGGCTLFGGGEPVDNASYQAGYGPGCNTGMQRQQPFSDYLDRDQTRYENDRSYRAGWNAGFHACSRPVNDAARGSLPAPSPYGGGPKP